ncbi:MAG TPA: ATP-binding protein [Nitrospira sp.]|nr:ATP-binding protein [Nitrospira sp.]
MGPRNDRRPLSRTLPTPDVPRHDEAGLFEDLILELSSGFVDIPLEQVDMSITDALRRLVEVLGADRSTLGSLGNNGTQLLVTHCYARPGFPTFPLAVMTQQFPWLLDKLRRGETVIVTDPQALPAEARVEREYCRRQGFQSCVTVPLSDKQSRFISVGSFTKNLPSSDIEKSVRLFGTLLAGVLARKQAEQERMADVHRLRVFLETTSLIPWEAETRTWQIRYIGPQVVTLLGYPVENWFEPGFWPSRLHAEDRPGVLEQCRDIVKSYDRGELEYRIRAADGRFVWVHDLVSVIRIAGRTELLRGFMLDITVKKEAEQRLRQLSRRLITAQEEERHRLARELHDDLCQRLSLLAVELDLQSQRTSPDRCRHAGMLAQQVRSLSSDVQKLAHGLHPATLDRLGLSAALRALCREVARVHSIRVECAIDDMPNNLSATYALCLYRVGQECVQNALKHGGADELHVALKQSGREIRLSVRDNGKGFDPDSEASRNGLGIIGMKERLQALSGTVSLKSKSGEGTRVEARLPWKAGKNETERRTGMSPVHER